MWAIRLLYELSDWQDASFVTLTYNNEHLPENGSLVPSHLTDFWKRLRKRLGKKIKYYACGEYGDKTKRPHYHAIVYGVSPYEKEHREAISDCWTFCDSFMFESRYKSIAEVTRQDICYVTGYVQKKLNGELGDKEYRQTGRLPPFSRVSHGMGLNFALENKERLLSNGYTFLNKQKIGIPRYFRDKFGVTAAELHGVEIKKTPEEIVKESNALYKLFESDMKKAGTWYPENLTQTAVRFERWLENFDFSLARQVEKDFQKYKQIKGVL